MFISGVKFTLLKLNAANVVYISSVFFFVFESSSSRQDLFSIFMKKNLVFQDGLAHVVVMKTFRGWHCPHCSYISPSQKGNLKVHILNRLARHFFFIFHSKSEKMYFFSFSRHANPGESFGCMFCGKHLSSRSSLQVHISQVHREQQKV